MNLKLTLVEFKRMFGASPVTIGQSVGIGQQHTNIREFTYQDQTLLVGERIGGSDRPFHVWERIDTRG